VTPKEHALLGDLAAGKRCIVEVGVFEGQTSRLLASRIDAGGMLYLVDPFPRSTLFERLSGLSFAEWIAHREVRLYAAKVCFIRETSADAAAQLALDGKVDLVFIDARHDYDSVREDFLLWQRKLRPEGVIAMHDSRPCAVRPDLDGQAGSVRLADELLRGCHGAWDVAGEADSVLALRRHA
jgi:predicted O-methyltransferase YrrM